MIVFLFVLLLAPLAMLPVYLSFRLRDNVLMGISVVCGLLIILVIPWVICMVVVTSRIPKHTPGPVPFGVFSGYWALVLLAYFICPFATYMGISVNGFNYFAVASLASSSATTVVLFLVATIIAFIVSLLLRGRAILTGQAIVLLFPTLFYLLLISVFIEYKVQAFGIYFVLFLFFLGEASLYYVAYQMSAVATNGAAPPIMTRESLSKGLNTLASGAGKVGSSLASGAGAVSESLRQASEQSKLPNLIQVRCTGGMYQNAVFDLNPGDELRLGTDPAQASLVFSSPEISRLHCVISCSTRRNTVRVTDYSTNGTYRSDGSRLSPRVSSELTLPCAIFFGNRPEIFEITARY